MTAPVLWKETLSLSSGAGFYTDIFEIMVWNKRIIIALHIRNFRPICEQLDCRSLSESVIGRDNILREKLV